VEKLIAALAEKGMTLSTCESFTGGLFSSELTAVSGASAVFTGSIVAYSTPAMWCTSIHKP
jgi:nicotinamide mononucleotide (NMN) deamidase PncC